MTFITISQGGPKAEDDIPDGVYPVVLSELKDPRTVTAQRGPKAGQEMDLIDWVFVVSSAGDVLDGRVIDGSTSTASGPRSKMFAWITALQGGRPPAPNTQFSKTDLIGKAALATISHGEGGWPQIENLGAMPAGMLGARVAAATGAPTNEPVAQASPIRETVVDATSNPATADLPF